MKIAHFSPLPPHRSGVADYCAELIPHLACQASVDAHTSGGAENPVVLPFPVHPMSRFLQTSGARLRYDVCLYHMGNHPTFHDEIYATLRRYPGITVLHDVDLYAFFVQRAAGRHGRAAFVREMSYEYGPAGTAEAYQAFSGDPTGPIQSRPILKRVIDASLGLIVHTELARQRLLSVRPAARVVHIPLAAKTDSQSPPPAQPELLARLPPESVIIGSFGYVAANKRIEMVLRALARLRDTVPEFHYLLIGEPVSDYTPLPLIERLNLGDIVHLLGYVNDATFQAYLHWVDISISLRSEPTGGEMSGSLVRCLARGMPTLVSDVGGYAVLPDTVAVKIRQDDEELDQIVAALWDLITDSDLRAAYGARAKEYIGKEHSFPALARRYVDFATELLSSMKVEAPSNNG